MKRSDFYVGQRIIYTAPGYRKIQVKATVVEIRDKFIVFLWNTDADCQNKLSIFRQETFDQMIPEEIISIKERVSRRIKKLWNESNYVKNNPKLVY